VPTNALTDRAALALVLADNGLIRRPVADCANAELELTVAFLIALAVVVYDAEVVNAALTSRVLVLAVV
jgi:uncharacterized membrane protein YGL010W